MRTLFTYLQYFYFIFLCKYNCKINHKSKSIDNYTKLTNKERITVNRAEKRDNEKLSMELRVQILPGLEARR